MSLKLIVHLPSHHDRDGPIDVREMAFHPSTYVRNALENIREQWDLPDDSDRKRFGLFMMSEDGVTTEDKYEKVTVTLDQTYTRIFRVRPCVSKLF